MLSRDIRRHIGQLAIAGFAGHDIPPELRLAGARVRSRRHHPLRPQRRRARAGRRSSRQAQSLAHELPLWVSVDQEGGRVARLKGPFTAWPPMQTLGRSGDEKLAERFARALAAELKAVGISLDYTPVLDIHTNPKNPVIGDRALAERADDVARLGRAIITDPAGRRASPRAASTSPGTATPAPIRTTSCRSSSIRRTGSRRWSWCRSARRSKPASPRS